MDEYIILYREETPVSLIFTSTKLVNGLTKKSFGTLKEAIAFAKTLNFNVTIYKSVAESTIKHDIKVSEDE